MPAKDNRYACNRCRLEFEFCPPDREYEPGEKIQVNCPRCGTAYVRKIYTFPKGYSSEPHC